MKEENVVYTSGFVCLGFGPAYSTGVFFFFLVFFRFRFTAGCQFVYLMSHDMRCEYTNA